MNDQSSLWINYESLVHINILGKHKILFKKVYNFQVGENVSWFRSWFKYIIFAT